MKRHVVIALTLLAGGRAMTLGYVTRAGDGAAGDPPREWLMPLIGDAAIGLTAFVVAYMIWRRPTSVTWLLAVVWSALAIFDAAAAYIVETTAPWPEFFMIELFGRSMFLAAIVMHLVILALLVERHTRLSFGVQASATLPG